jgi:hypothetical protein
MTSGQWEAGLAGKKREGERHDIKASLEVDELLSERKSQVIPVHEDQCDVSLTLDRIVTMIA